MRTLLRKLEEAEGTVVGTDWAALEVSLAKVPWGNDRAIDQFWMHDADLAAAIREDPERAVELWNAAAPPEFQAEISMEEPEAEDLAKE